MKGNVVKALHFGILLASFLQFIAFPVQAQGTTAFNYQGQLKSNGTNANGAYTIVFKLYDSSTNGNQIGATVTNNVTIANGLFNVALDFGGAFDGSSRWLDIAVSSDGGATFSPLTPRQQLLAAPYALYSVNAATAASAGSVSAANISGTLQLGQLPGAVLTNNENGVNLNGSFFGNGGGLTNVSGTTSWQVYAGTVVQAKPGIGHLLTNSALVTVTLPPTPNVGDTFRVSSIGAGGWRLAANPGQSVSVARLALVNTWNALPINRLWTSAASSADGSKLIASESGGALYTSADSGASWTRTKAPTNNWSAVASSGDGTKLVAVALNGLIYTSPDQGATWHTNNAPVAAWQCVASSSDGTKLVAGANGIPPYTSADSGATWTAQTNFADGQPNQNWQAVVSSSGGSVLAAIGSGALFNSTDSGATWNQQTHSFLWDSIACSADGSVDIMGPYPGQISTLSSGNLVVLNNSPSVSWTHLACSADGTKLAGVTYNGLIYTSTDSGATWTGRATVQKWTAVTSSSDGTKLVATVSGGLIYISTDSGVTWTASSGPPSQLVGGQNTAIELLYVGNGLFVPISFFGTPGIDFVVN